jgi:hypothetical protein
LEQTNHSGTNTNTIVTTNQTSTLTNASNRECVKEVFNNLSKFFNKQNRLLDELLSLKDDLNFVIENRNKSKLSNKLSESIIHDSNNLNNSYYSHNNIRNKGNKNDINNNSILLNNSYISNISNNFICKKYNIKDNINYKDNKIQLTKFQEFLNQYNENKNIILLVDSKNNIFELIKRNDLTINNITNNDNIVSILGKLKDSYNVEDRLLNIEIKDHYDNRSISELDISKVTDLNISQIMRECNNNTENN